MSRRVQIVLLCEDQQQQAFMRRFLVRTGWETRNIRVEMAPRGRCSAEFVRNRFPKELVLVPTWNIEAWIAYLDGQSVDEQKDDYPRLRRPRECAPHVAALVDMCQRGKLREPAPSSLTTGCTEYRRWVSSL